MLPYATREPRYSRNNPDDTQKHSDERKEIEAEKDFLLQYHQRA
jgi:hypothetical protein